GTWRDTIVGIITMSVIFLSYLLSYDILDNKTILDYRTKVLISIGITIAFVAIIFGILIVVEKIFGL
ncbi:MAG: hypothetical protein J6Q55_02830, partial [Clostridia bacterium]|nr:hypothetical protein [Clostridia bacterium]